MTRVSGNVKTNLLPWVPLLLIVTSFTLTSYGTREMLWTGGGCYERPRAVTRRLMLYWDERTKESA